MSGQEVSREMPIFNGTLEEIEAAKKEWNETHPEDENAPAAAAAGRTIPIKLEEEFYAAVHDTRNNREKYLGASTSGPGPLTRIAQRMAEYTKIKIEKTLDEVAKIQAEESNKVALDPGSASMKMKTDLVEAEAMNMDCTEENEKEVDEVDEGSHECLIEAMRVRRQNKPVIPSKVQEQMIKTVYAPIRGKRPVYFMTIEEMDRSSKVKKRHHDPDEPLDKSLISLDEIIKIEKSKNRDHEPMDKSLMSLDEIIKIEKNKNRDPERASVSQSQSDIETIGEWSFRSVLTIPNPKRMRCSSDETAENNPTSPSPPGIKNRIGDSREGFRGNMARHGSLSSLDGHSLTITKSRREFWFPMDMEIGNWTMWQEDTDLEVKTREEMLDRDRQPSPEYVLNQMTQNGFKVEYEAMEVDENASLSEEESRAKRWRVVYSVQDVKGVGVAARKELAKQLAAFDVLRVVKERMPQLKLPFCQIPLADRVSPFLAHLLAKECHQRNIPLKYNLITELDDTVFSRARFTAVYTCGDVKFNGYSHRNGDDAKKMAAKAAYEAITGESVPYDPLTFGEECGDATHYNYVWSEAHHVYDAKDSNDIKCFTKTNLFGNNPSAVGEAARKKEKPVDQATKEEAERIYNEELDLMKNIHELKVQRGIDPNKIDESFYMDYPDGVQKNIVDSLETQARKLGEKMAATQRTATMRELDGDFAEAEDDDAEDDGDQPRRDW